MNKTKVEFTYNTGFTSIWETYVEKLIITESSIEYSKKWLEFECENGLDRHHERTNINWKLSKCEDGYIQVLHELVSYLAFDLDKDSICEVLDAGTIHFKVITPNGKVLEGSFCPLLNLEIVERIRYYIDPYIKEVKVPDLLKKEEIGNNGLSKNII